jgi:hypothetical protein
MAPIESEIPLDQARWMSDWDISQMNSQMSVIRSFGNSRPAQMQSEIGQFFNLSNPVDFTVSKEGSGEIFVHNLRVPNGGATFKAYASVPVALRAAGAGFSGWSDGVAAAERTVIIEDGMTLTARFGGSILSKR